MGNVKRYALGFSYIGTEYVGYQSQGTNNAVQDRVEYAVSKVANHPVRVGCAGRTDKGVHALMQVVHFDTTSERSDRQWVKGINANLPNDIVVLWISEQDETFDARFSARSRAYVYLLNTQDQDLIMSQYSWFVKDLDVEKMKEAMAYLLGEQDFHVFQSRHCQAKHSMRCIQEVSIQKVGGMIYFYIKANAFLHHMVRKIVATLVGVGEGKLSPESVKIMIEEKDRDAVPGQAPAKGLFLKQVEYADKWQIEAKGTSQLLGEWDV